MTCIAAIEDADGVWLAADSAVTSGDNKDSFHGKAWKDPKSGIAFGYAGNLSTGQAIRYNIRIPKTVPGMDGVEWCVKKLVPAIKRALDDVKPNDDGSYNFQLLLALPSGIYEIGSDFSVTRSPRGYSSIGSGCDFAFGSFFSTKKEKPRARVLLAVESACHHSSSCALPVQLIRVE